jgi:ABC-type uncharacterized transport system substrate-binding protein
MKVKILFLILALSFSLPFSCVKKQKEIQNEKKTYKILHIMSYNSPWQWTDDQLKGFKEVFNDLAPIYRIYQMNMKVKSSPEEIKQSADEASKIIDEWQPDIVYLSDDGALEHVATKYINSKIPFVFSGVNAEPMKYGINNASNITGVLEREHFTQSIKLLKEIAPWIKNITVIADDDPAWLPVMERYKELVKSELTYINFSSWNIIKTYSDYQSKVKELSSSDNALCIIGWFTFKKADGRNATELEVAKWTAENSMLPDVTFWKDRVSKGTLCAIYISAYEQGHSAGILARKILTENVSPSALPIEPTLKGKPVINLARAKKLNLNIKSSLLLSTDIIEKYVWEK